MRSIYLLAICIVVLCAAATEEIHTEESHAATASDIVPWHSQVVMKTVPTAIVHDSLRPMLVQARAQTATAGRRRKKAYKEKLRKAYKRNPKMCKDWIPASKCNYFRKRYPTCRVTFQCRSDKFGTPMSRACCSTCSKKLVKPKCRNKTSVCILLTLKSKSRCRPRSNFIAKCPLACGTCTPKKQKNVKAKQGVAKALAQETKAEEWVRSTNVFRCMHGVPPVSWSRAVAKSAQAWADKGIFKHSRSYHIPSPAGPAGENLALGHDSASGANKAWYEEVHDCFGFPGCKGNHGSKGKNGNAIGHFTALIWKGVKTIGCGQKLMKSGRWKGRIMYVCRYRASAKVSCDTPNVTGCYKKNVPKPVRSMKQCVKAMAEAFTKKQNVVSKACRTARDSNHGFYIYPYVAKSYKRKKNCKGSGDTPLKRAVWEYKNCWIYTKNVQYANKCQYFIEGLKFQKNYKGGGGCKNRYVVGKCAATCLCGKKHPPPVEVSKTVKSGYTAAMRRRRAPRRWRRGRRSARRRRARWSRRRARWSRRRARWSRRRARWIRRRARFWIRRRRSGKARKERASKAKSRQQERRSKARQERHSKAKARQERRSKAKARRQERRSKARARARARAMQRERRGKSWRRIARARAMQQERRSKSRARHNRRSKSKANKKGCKDNKPSKCPGWKARYCKKSTYVRSHCRKTCGICKPSQTKMAKAERVANFGRDCWRGCRRKQGRCGWCGSKGVCCRLGWSGNGCDGRLGLRGKGHVCVAQKKPEANKRKPLKLENYARDCWRGCRRKQGRCGWCGSEGMCCRLGWRGNGCDGRLGLRGKGHVCVAQTKQKTDEEEYDDDGDDDGGSDSDGDSLTAA